MAARPSERPRGAPLKEYRLVPVTDPAERAELERRFRNARKVVEVETTAAGVREVYRQLPAAERLQLLARLLKELPDDEQRELLARLRPKAAQRPQARRPRRNGEK